MSDAAQSAIGPVSAALEADLRQWVRRQGIVVWLDLDDHYSAFVDRLILERATASLPYDVYAFRGSHLALMLALEGVAGGADKVPLLVHLPGFTEDTVRETPALELYLAGTRYRKALATLVTEAAAGHVRPEEIERFKALPGLTLQRADQWLAALIDAPTGGFAAQLRGMKIETVLDELIAGDSTLSNPLAADATALWPHLEASIGLANQWRSITLHDAQSTRPLDIAFVAASWALCVEYVDDLKRAPVSPLLAPAKTLPASVVQTCRALALHLRERHRTFYERTADETEAILADEVQAARAEDLGRVDTFRFEEDHVLRAALVALTDERWNVAADWAARRVDAPGSFWLDPARQSAWMLVKDVAQLGHAIGRAGERLQATSIDSALDAYVTKGSDVDQRHRHLEQRRAALLFPELPEFATLRTRLDAARTLWRRWADSWARDFNALCKQQGFLPSLNLQQRTLFDDVVRPLAQERTALFMIDAFRFEMGEELYRALADTPATTVHLNARLAELPTVTEVGMNVLAPVCVAGRLAPALSAADTGSKVLGFAAGEFRVSDPETRKRAMHARVGGRTCPLLTLDEVVADPSLKHAIAQATLVVVHSQEIDTAGENGLGPNVFEHVMQKLRAAWRLLRDAGVRRFVFTADHGFLLLDDGTGTAQSHGRKIDPKRRHVFSTVAADHTGEVRVALSDLGYDGVPGQNVMFPETTAVFDTGRRSMSFVHGGNSLQERVIPVLTVVHRAGTGGSTVQYAVRAQTRDGVAGMHCVELKIDVLAQDTLDFGSTREIELALRADDASDVQVELCQARGKARVSGAGVMAQVGETIELFFRLLGQSDARVRVEIYHPHPNTVAEVAPCIPDGRFAVVVARHGTPMAVVTSEVRWLDDLPDDGTRQLFEHLHRHGSITETEAATMLGGPRGVRRFAAHFDELVLKLPFTVRIDIVGGQKHFIRMGGSQ